ncbi:MAG TPA: superoxide dismutase family protein [Burkholderiales bacterium]|nr:superoxide dismutase family protein [Burkholderiales bacterium]
MNRMLVLTVLSLSLAACAGDKAGPRAVANLQPTQGNTASGEVVFEQKGSVVLVKAEVKGLKPNAEHGFHIHEKGDCSAADGTSAGGHFNPAGKPHGSHHMMEAHAGDMPNLKADANGVAKLNAELTNVTLNAGASNILGKGVIVHAMPDDYKSQPTGNAGARIACGVIK